MAGTKITITVVDEGYFQKTFNLSTTTNLKKLIDRYCGHLCTDCSDQNLLELWYETSKIQDGHTYEALQMENDDIVNVRVSQRCTHGSCPIPPQQTLPNIHYINQPRAVEDPGAILEEEQQPKAPERVTMRIKDQLGFEVVMRMKVDMVFEKVLETFALQVEREAHECRFMMDNERLLETDTPAKKGSEDGDQIDVY